MKIIVDSDFLFGLVIGVDAHHKNCKKLLKKCSKDNVKLVALNLVIQETATVISNKRSQQDSLLFLDMVSKMPIDIIDLNSEVENLAWEVFKKQTKKGTSFIDCANLAFCQKYKLDGILSFDDFYPKEFIFS